MSDQRLRELERRWRESGRVEEEAEYLRERLRIGDLTPERLELAAHCGREGARRSIGAASADDVGSWAEALLGLPSLGVEELTRLCIAWALVLPLREEVEHWQVSPAQLLRDVEAALCNGDWEIRHELARRSEKVGGELTAEPHLLFVIAAAHEISEPRSLLRQVWHLASVIGFDRTVDAARREVAPWALGIADPVLERVMARAES